jgi:hypothetical protein
VNSELTAASQTGHSSGTMSHQQEDEISSAIAAIGPSESKVLRLKIMRVSVKHKCYYYGMYFLILSYYQSVTG